MPTIDVGGVEKNFIIISNYLSNKFKNISIITTSKEKRNKFEKNINFVTLNSLNTIFLNRRVKFFFGLILLSIHLLKKKNNLVLCFQANIYCVYVCKIFGAKVIIRSNSAPEGWSQNYFKKLIYKNALNSADRVIVNSFEFKKSLKRKFNVKSICIYNPLNKFEVIKNSKKKIKIPFFKKNYFNFINVARFEEQKDHMTLVKAFLILTSKIKYKLLLIGDGSKKSEIKKFIYEKKLKNIKLKGALDNPFPYIKKADVFILSSIYEGLPNVLLESIALNKAVISSNCPTGPSEILDKGKGGILFKTGDAKDLAKKILYYVKNRKKIKKKINYAKKRMNRFESRYNLEKYEKLIKSL